MWLLATLGLRPLLLPDEGRYAEVAREMLAGNALVPLLNGLPFFHKPPLLYWIDIGAMRVFGLNAFAARIGPALGAWVMGAALYFGLRYWSGKRSAAIGLLVLATCPLYFLSAQYVNHDMLVAALITVAILAFARALERAPHMHLGWLVGAWAACALAMLAKGLIGFVLPALVIGPWLLWQGRWRDMLRLLHPLGLLVAALIAAPWFVVTQAGYPGFYDYFFMEQQFRRFAQSSFNNVQPSWFFLLVLPLTTLPWSVRLPQTLRGLWLARTASALRLLGWQREADVTPPLVPQPHVPATRLSASQWPAQATHRIGPESEASRSLSPGLFGDPQNLLYAWWVVAVVLFFSLPSSKLVGYVLPALVPWCALLARTLEGAVVRMRNVLAGIAIALCLGAVLALTWQQPRGDRAIANTLAAHLQPTDRVVMLETYPYDLPFHARLTQPVVVLSDWSDPNLPRRDNWRKELFDAARFDPKGGAATLLLPGALRSMACSGEIGTLWVLARERDAKALNVVSGMEPVMARDGLGLWKAPLRACP
ncbi:MAG: phospholipid carrier-dependent glycosyltransferase [Burkholderiaceae bacterium]